MIYFDDCLILSNESAQTDDYEFAMQSLNEQIELAGMLITEGVADTLRDWWQRFVNSIKRFWNWLFGKTEEKAKEIETTVKQVEDGLKKIATVAATPPKPPASATPAQKEAAVNASEEIGKIATATKQIAVKTTLITRPDQVAALHKKGIEALTYALNKQEEYTDQIGGSIKQKVEEAAELKEFNVELQSFREMRALAPKHREALATCRKDFEVFEKVASQQITRHVVMDRDPGGKMVKTRVGQGWITMGGNLNSYSLTRLGQSLANIAKAVKGVSGKVDASLSQLAAAEKRISIDADRERHIGNYGESGSLLDAYM